MKSDHIKMKNSTSNNVVSIVLKYLLQLLGLAAFYGILLYSTSSFWLHALLNKFTRISILSTPDFHSQIIYLLIIYSIFCYFANNFILHLYEKGKTKQLIISFIIDLLIVPFGILIMIIYNNIALKGEPAALDTSLYNIYLITGLLVIKNFIAIKILSKNTAVGKKPGK